MQNNSRGPSMGGGTTQLQQTHVPSTNNMIRSPSDLRPGDILLGRGNKHQKWSGNKHFRSLILERQEEYVSVRGDNRTKNEIARQILEAVRNGTTTSLPAAQAAPSAATCMVVPALKNGRFLKLVEPEVLAQMGLQPATDEGDAVVDEHEHYWQEVTNDAALEKIKMALRQQKRWGASNDDESSSSSSDIDGEEGSNDSDYEKMPKKKGKKKATVRSKAKQAKNKTKKKKPKRRKKSDRSQGGDGGGSIITSSFDGGGIPLHVSIGGEGGGLVGTGGTVTALAGSMPALLGLAVQPVSNINATNATAFATTGGNVNSSNSDLFQLLAQWRQQEGAAQTQAQTQAQAQQEMILQLLAQQQILQLLVQQQRERPSPNGINATNANVNAPNITNANAAVIAALMQQQQRAQQQQQQQHTLLLQQLLQQRQQQQSTNAGGDTNSSNAIPALLLQQLIQQGQQVGTLHHHQQQLPALTAAAAAAAPGGLPPDDVAALLLLLSGNNNANAATTNNAQRDSTSAAGESKTGDDATARFR